MIISDHWKRVCSGILIYTVTVVNLNFTHHSPYNNVSGWGSLSRPIIICSSFACCHTGLGTVTRVHK